MDKFNKAHLDSDHFQLAPSLKELVAKALDLSSIDIHRALEVGCGQGLQLSSFKFFETLGIDRSQEAIKKASLNFPQGSFKCLSSLSLNELEGEFDLILDSHHIHYLSSKDDISHYLENVFQKLSVGGLFCMEAMVSHKKMLLENMEVTVLDFMEYERLFINKGFRILYLMMPTGRKIIADKKRKAALSSDPDVLLVIATKEDVANCIENS
ncbi:class I SAM-dependent methyltransferase [Halobacteriovorax sp. DPLXC-1]|uniref:class I SAM-dependent methyltransferase n=1 Tax=Halobacteriovorax sp. DPLXC-1 TaxID=3110771 RepID=UPI002FEFD0A5